MAHKVYRKLQFDSIEKDFNLSTDEEDADSEKEEADNPSPKISPVQSPVPSDDNPTLCGGGRKREMQSDPTLVVTRDYYGLAQTVGGNHSCLVLVTNRSRNM